MSTRYRMIQIETTEPTKKNNKVIKNVDDVISGSSDDINNIIENLKRKHFKSTNVVKETTIEKSSKKNINETKKEKRNITNDENKPVIKNKTK